MAIFHKQTDVPGPSLLATPYPCLEGRCVCLNKRRPFSKNREVTRELARYHGWSPWRTCERGCDQIADWLTYDVSGCCRLSKQFISVPNHTCYWPGILSVIRAWLPPSCCSSHGCFHPSIMHVSLYAFVSLCVCLVYVSVCVSVVCLLRVALRVFLYMRLSLCVCLSVCVSLYVRPCVCFSRGKERLLK